METNYMGCVTCILISFYLSNIESLKKRHTTLITCIGWTIYILFFKGGINGIYPNRIGT